MATGGKPSGRRVKTPEGYSAFVPDPLPPKLDWTPSLVGALSDADRAIGNLAGEGRALPNPHLLLRPFVRREAVLSSRIEGTQATLGELLAVEAGSVVERSPDDLREVANYVVAMEHGLKRLAKLPLSLRLIRELHKRLMRGVRGNQATPGEFRRSQNWIGPPGCTPGTASYVPPPPQEMNGCLTELEKFLHDTSLPPLVHISMAHYQFEAIHPFLDGNGRIGRLLVTLFLVERNILPTPLLYLSAFFEATRNDYYAHLNAVSHRSEWQPWLEYFLRGVARQAEDAISRAQAIQELIARWRQAVAGSPSKVPTSLIDLLAANPYCTLKGVADQLEVAFTTAQRGVEKLVQQGILAEVSGGKRDRVYCAQALLEILERPARLSSVSELEPR